MRLPFALLLGLIAFTATHAAEPLPNIVVILADDLGFGELQCLNPTRGKIPTPQLDALASNALVFTDGHSGSSVCTPTRYGLMTGRYAWRTRLQSGVLTGGESLIAEDRLTIAKLLRQRGYETAIIGKWHLGMLYDGQANADKVPLGAKISHGPLDRGGFEYFRGFHHARQMDIWIENDTVTQRLTAVEMLPKLTETAVAFIRERRASERPFFLYIPWNSPHSPVAPAAAWQGKSGLNAHADFVMQTDDSFGQVFQALRETGQFDNTLIVCSSDNGTSAPTSNMAQLNHLGHYPSGDLRGSKADIWDGGHRVPLIASWPAVIGQSRRTDALVCLTDLLATVAEIVGADLPETAGEDSISFLNVLRNSGEPQRTSVIHHSIEGQFAIRDSQWKLICCPGSGGWSDPGTKAALQAIGDEGPFVQLYDMSRDLGEQQNLAGSLPEKVSELRNLLDRQIAAGRTTPGTKQSNDVEIVVEKWRKSSAKPAKRRS